MIRVEVEKVVRTCSGEGCKNSKWCKRGEIHFESRREDGVS